MKTSKQVQILALLLVSVFCITANAASKSDLAKEKRWENQVVDSLLVGENIKLRADDTEFLALFAEPSTSKAKGGVIILHGIGAHPAWPDVVEPLRMQLPEHGWYTLSLQMPILGNEATDKDYPPLFPEVLTRIQAGVDFLKKKGIHNIVLSGHSLGTSMASYYLANHPDSSIKTFAIISGGPGVPGDPMEDSLANFKKMNGLNIIDIYGSEDREPVMQTLKQRMQLNKPGYLSIKVEGANHFYHGRQAQLVKALASQLDQLQK